jgi:hypothetical protein
VWRPGVLAVVIAMCGVLFPNYAPAGEQQSEGAHPETIPKAFDGAGDEFKEGGKEIGSGFRGIGRGVRDTFTGQRSADDYKEGKNIGTGFKHAGRGVAGGTRAVGRQIKKGAEGDGAQSD